MQLAFVNKHQSAGYVLLGLARYCRRMDTNLEYPPALLHTRLQSCDCNETTSTRVTTHHRPKHRRPPPAKQARHYSSLAHGHAIHGFPAAGSMGRWSLSSPSAFMTCRRRRPHLHHDHYPCRYAGTRAPWRTPRTGLDDTRVAHHDRESSALRATCPAFLFVRLQRWAPAGLSGASILPFSSALLFSRPFPRMPPLVLPGSAKRVPAGSQI